MKHSPSNMAAIVRLVHALLIITATITVQTDGCPVQCRSCDNERVVCSQAGLTHLPESLPENSLTVDFAQNEITSLKGLPPLPNTMSIQLAGNKISVLEGKSFQKVPQLLRLDLSMNQIRKIYKQGFKGMDNVMTISLNGNFITSIGKIFSNTPALTSLRLSFNQITEIGKDSFEDNKMLKMLDLSNNAISKIHPKAFEKLDMLRILLLSNNPLGTLPELTFTTNILTLADFTNCQLTAVPRRMPPSLNDFRLGNNRITKIHFNDFNNNTELNLLTLNDNQISDVEHRSFYYLENLMELWMSRNMMVYIPRGLPTHLEKFHIDNNQVVELEPMLFKQGSMLKVMSLEANNVQKIHRDALKEVKHIETLNLQGNQISEIEAGTFINLESLKSLTLADNPIQKIQDRAFGNLNNMTDLKLAHIHTDKQILRGQKVVAENLLSSMPNLKDLNLMSSVELTKDLLEVFDDTIKPLDKIDRVNLQYNDLESLPGTVRKVFKNAGSVLLDGNVFVCDKKLVWLNRWMQSASTVQFSQHEQPTCHRSGDLNGRSISELLENEFIEVSIQKEPENTPNREAVHKAPEPEPPIQPEKKQAPPESRQPDILGTLGGSRRRSENRLQAVSKYDNQGGHQQPRGSNIQPQSPVQPPNNRGPFMGTRVVIKAPKGSLKSSTKKVGWSKLSKKEKELRKAARKAKRLQDRADRRNARKSRGNRRNRGNRVSGREKRRIKKNCTTDENGNVKCTRRNRKRCKVQADGSTKCRRHKGGKKRKSRKAKKLEDITQKQ